MSNLEEFITTTIKKGEEGSGDLEQLKRILEELDEEPKIIYTSYNIKSNA